MKKDERPVKIAENIYHYRNGYRLRCWVNGKRTWRCLESAGAKAAKIEGARLALELADQAENGKAPFQAGDSPKSLYDLIDQFLVEGCPNDRLEKRLPEGQTRLRYLLQRPMEYFGKLSPENLRKPHLVSYAAWATKRMRFGKGNRTVDMEMVALSNVYRWAISIGLVENNPMLGRPRFQRQGEVRSCREVAPESGDEVHRVAAEFFGWPQSEVLAWQYLLQAFTGCRTSEILRLRMDAKTPEDPGYVDGGYLFIERSKKGVQPYVVIHAALAELIRAHHHWHAVRFPHCPWWLPGRTGENHLDPGSLSHGLMRACRELELPHRSPHGLRSYYVTARRGEIGADGQGIPDWQIAAEIGDRSVDLIHKTYGDRPANFRGGNRHTWLPSNGEPAWARWAPENNGVIPLPSRAKSSECQVG
jgi:integrase